MLGFQGKDLGLGAWAIWMSVDADVGDVPDAGAAVFKAWALNSEPYLDVGI